MATVRMAAVGDVHCREDSRGDLRPVFAQVNEAADVLLLCGDLVDYGLPEEARVLVAELAVVRVPVLAVLGNHDYHSDRVPEVTAILEGAGVRVLDGGACEVHGIGFAGVKGFGGGYGKHALGGWGETGIKQFVQEVLVEAEKLENALNSLDTPVKVALLHYSPVAATVEGEPPEIFPFLGSTRLEEPLARHHVAAAFHGHAHRGTPEGVLSCGTPVFNVAMPLLRRRYPDRPPFRVFKLEV